MRRPGPLASLCAAALLAAACRDRPAGDEAAIRERLREKGTAELMDEVSRTSFEAPKDGRLTGRQVEMYLAVQERARKIREVAGERKEDAATADLRAAQELGHNPKELQWVEERVLEAQVARLGEELDRKLDESRQRFVQRLREQRKTAADAARRAEIDRQIAEFGRSVRSGGPEASPALRHNTELLARYEARLGELGLAGMAQQEPSSEKGALHGKR